MIGKIRTKTLVKFILLARLTIQQRRIASVEQIMEEIGCGKITAYRYRNALRCVYPEQFPPQPPVATRTENIAEQRNLDNY